MVVDELTGTVVDELFHALADPTRRDILRRCAAGEPSVSQLAQAYPMSFAAVQKHVAVMERAGLVTKERRGREQLVRTDAAALGRARRALDELEKSWRGRVDRMSDVLERNALSVIGVDTDYDNLAVALTTEFDAQIERVWELWSDPRKLERWMAPPTYQATVEKHDLTRGGEITFSMTGPDGDKHWGIWRVTAVDRPTSLEFTDAFADVNGTPIADSPVSRVTVRLVERDGGTQMEIHSTFDSREDMEKWVSMGSVEGWQQAVGQMDALLE